VLLHAVIRKFLDAQRIHNLTRYLQALHEKGRANTDHTTLLLNCYTKLKDVQKLDEFVNVRSRFCPAASPHSLCSRAVGCGPEVRRADGHQSVPPGRLLQSEFTCRPSTWLAQGSESGHLRVVWCVQHALFLAQKHREHDLYLKIQ
jgi:hypothetical protein